MDMFYKTSNAKVLLKMKSNEEEYSNTFVEAQNRIYNKYHQRRELQI